MENQPNQPQKGGNKALWIVLVIVILAVAGYGIYALISSNANNTNNANTTNNANQAVNTNNAVNTNSAANTNGNVNSATNANTNSATNTNVDTSGWKTYTNSEYGYTMKYPSDWTYEDIYLTKDPLNAFQTPIKYSIFYSPGKQYHLIIGVKKASAQGSIYYRTSLGAGDIVSSRPEYIGAVKVNTWKLVYQGKANEIFFYPVGSGTTHVNIDEYEISASFAQADVGDVNLPDLTEAPIYSQLLAIMSSISLSD